MPDAESAFSPNRSSSSDICASGLTAVPVATPTEGTLGSSTSIRSGTGVGSISGICTSEFGSAETASTPTSGFTVVDVAGGISDFVCVDCSGLIVVDVIDVVEPSIWYLRTYFSFVGVSVSGCNG
jgi:hypothetical protein